MGVPLHRALKTIRKCRISLGGTLSQPGGPLPWLLGKRTTRQSRIECDYHLEPRFDLGAFDVLRRRKP